MGKENGVEENYASKIWIAGSIIALLFSLILITVFTFSVLLLVFAGVLVAIFFRSLSNLLRRKTRWPDAVCLTIAILGSILLIAGFFWLIGSQIQAQAAELSEVLPATLEKAKSQLSGSKLGDHIVDQMSSKDSMQRLQKFAGSFFKSTLGAFGDVYVVLFIGIFLTVSPDIYTRGVVALVPQKGRKRAEQIMGDMGSQVKNWLKGKLFSMFVVFVLTAIGLAILGIPVWLVLALLAGLISFIPNFGPLIALIPAVLVGFMDSEQTALLVVCLYILVQFIESNFITPLVQQRMVQIPPALVITAQLILGTLTGLWGLMLSTPLTVVLIVLVQQLYIDPQAKA